MEYLKTKYYVTEEIVKKIPLNNKLQDYVYQTLEEEKYYETEHDRNSAFDMIDLVFIGYCYTHDKELKNKLLPQQKIFLIDNEFLERTIVEIVDKYMNSKFAIESKLGEIDCEVCGSYYETD